MTNNNYYFSIIIFFFFTISHFSQDGILDTSFGINGVTVTDIADDDIANSFIIQNDGKIMVNSSYTQNNEKVNILLRYFPNGDVDNSLGVITLNFPEFVGLEYKQIVQQQNGKILLFGLYLENNETHIIISRFTSEGILDNTFAINGHKTLNLFTEFYYLNRVFIQPDDKISIIAFDADNANSVKIQQLLPNGDADITYANNGVLELVFNNSNLEIYSPKLLDDNSILLSSKNTNTNDLGLHKILNTGVIDTSFGNAGSTIFGNGSNQVFSKISNNAIFVVYEDLQNLKWISKLDSSGQLDTAFGTNGFIEITTLFGDLYPIFRDIKIQTDNKFILDGAYIGYEGSMTFLFRFNTDGSLDTNFGVSGQSNLQQPVLMGDLSVQDDQILTLNSLVIVDVFGNSFFDIILAKFSNNVLTIKDESIINTNVMPNPSDGIFTIKNESLLINTPFKIYDITGKILKTGILTNNQIDLSNFKTGIYTLHIKNNLIKLIKK